MSSVREFISHVSKYGLARSNRFQVLIPLPQSLQPKTNNTGQDKTSSFLGSEVVQTISSFFGGGNIQVTRGLDLMCEQTDLPGKNIATTDIKYNGDFYKIPYGAVYGVQNFIFKVSRDLHEKNIIDEWMSLIYDPVTHEVRYMDDISVNLVINKLDEQDNVVYSVVLKDAFPVVCDPIIMSNEENDAFSKLNVQFAFSGWAREGESESKSQGVSSLSQTPLGRILSPITSSPAVQKALEVVDRETGIDLEGEAVNIYNQVDSIVRNTTGESINKHVGLIESIRAATSSNNKLSNNQKTILLDKIDNVITNLRS
jgi:hypothetical protein